jgi:phage shock protein C
MVNQQPRRLTRSDDRLLGGVAGGIAEYFAIDPTLVRLGFVVVALLGFGGAALAYVILWIVLPSPEAAAARGPGPRGGGGPVLFVLLALALVILLAGGLVWLSVASLHLFWISMRSLPFWIVLFLIVWLALRSRGSRAS